VLHLHGGRAYGGVETLLVSLARHAALAPTLDQTFALVFPGRLAGELADAGAPVAIVGPARASRPLGVLRARRHVAALVRQLRPSAAIVHSPWAHVVCGPALARRGCRIVWWVHGVADPPTWVDRLAARRPPSAVVFNSRFSAERARMRLDGRPSCVLYPPVAPVSPLRADERAALRASLGASEDEVVILQASRFEALKGHLALLEAAAHLDPARPWRLWLAGAPAASGPLSRRAIERRAAALGIAGRLAFLGERRDLRRVFGAADIYCQPNTRPDGLGLAFLEAMHAGLPVVTSAFDGAPEVVDDSCGVLVPPGEVGALATALEELVRDAARRRRLGEAGRARAARLTDPAARMADLAAFVGRVAGTS
jgi:glycosyltransferase involved in cell wall biosynthesis